MESPYFILYKLSENEMLYWRELEHTKTSVTVCKGKVGELGNIIIFKGSLFSSLRKKYNKEIMEITSHGYKELIEEDYSYLDVEFDLKSKDYDINCKYYLEVKEFIENILVKTCLGFTIFDEFEMYEDEIIRVTCKVVSVDLARDILEKALIKSEFSNYRKIFECDFR